MSNGMGNRGLRFVCLFTLFLRCGIGDGSDDDYTDLYTVHMDAKHADYVTEYLTKVGFEFQHQVADYYIFKDAESQSSTSIAVIRSKIKMKVKSMKRVRKQYLSYEPDADNSQKTRSSKILHMKKGGAAPGRKIIMCAPYFDALQGIDEAWKLGYTGKGVVVAVTDTGFTVDHPELSPNINLELSKNFVEDDTSDLSPGDNREYMLSHVNHGNDCASVVAGVYNNYLCGAGVAHNATLAVLKVGRLIEDHIIQKDIFETDETKYGQGLIHKFSKIDIYSNSWGASVGPLPSCSFIKDILKMGTEQGRGSKGSIYVFPSERVGDCLTSSIYTITVGGLNYDRSLPGNSVQSSVTLVSAFSGQNSSFSDKKMVTAFLNPNKPCTNSFGGTSAATAVVAGITALMLQANPNLTWRDVQHVLVQSAQKCCLENFQPNAAGHYFHDMLGFGIVNATKAVLLAATWNATPQQVNVAVDFIWQNANLSANVTCIDGCVERVEHVKVTFRVVSKIQVRLTLRSPAGTDSIMANGVKIPVEDQCQEVETLSVNFWDESSTGLWTMITETCENGYLERCVESKDVVTDVNVVIYGTGTQGNNTEDNAATTHSSPDACSTTSEYSTTPVNDHPEQTTWTVIAVVVAVVIVGIVIT